MQCILWSNPDSLQYYNSLADDEYGYRGVNSMMRRLDLAKQTMQALQI